MASFVATPRPTGTGSSMSVACNVAQPPDRVAAPVSLCRCSGAPRLAGSVLRLPLSPSKIGSTSPAACKVSTKYEPSDLERLWVAYAGPWADNFCSHMAPLDNSTRVWVDTLAEHARLQTQYRQDDNTSPAEVSALEHNRITV